MAERRILLKRKPNDWLDNALNTWLGIENTVAPFTLEKILNQDQEPFMTQVRNQPKARTGIFGPEQPSVDLNEILKRRFPNVRLEDLGILGKGGEVVKRGVRGAVGDTLNIGTEYSKPSSIFTRWGIGAFGGVFQKGAAGGAKVRPKQELVTDPVKQKQLVSNIKNAGTGSEGFSKELLKSRNTRIELEKKAVALGIPKGGTKTKLTENIYNKVNELEKSFVGSAQDSPFKKVTDLPQNIQKAVERRNVDFIDGKIKLPNGDVATATSIDKLIKVIKEREKKGLSRNSDPTKSLTDEQRLKRLQALPDNANVIEVRKAEEVNDSRTVTKAEGIRIAKHNIADRKQYIADLEATKELLKEEVAPREVPVGQDLIQKAEARFGITDDVLEAGYITPEGKLLDLSGRHESGEFMRIAGRNVLKEGQATDFYKGTRNTDHGDLGSDIANVIEKRGVKAVRNPNQSYQSANLDPDTSNFWQVHKSTTDTLNNFMKNSGVIRVSADEPQVAGGQGSMFADLSEVDLKNITDAQWAQIARMKSGSNTAVMDVILPEGAGSQTFAETEFRSVENLKRAVDKIIKEQEAVPAVKTIETVEGNIARAAAPEQVAESGFAIQAAPFKLGKSGGKPQKFVPIVQKKTSVIPVSKIQKAEEAAISSRANKIANATLPEGQKQNLVTTDRIQQFITDENIQMIQGWDKKHGKWRNKIEDTINKQLIGNPAFEALSLPDKASVIGLVERPIRELTFPEIQKLTTNLKMKSPADPKTGKPRKDSFIREVDTVIGCGNNCAECYAAGLCGQQQVTFQDPVPTTIHPDEVIDPKTLVRVGVNGDGGIDWQHTANEMRKLLDRSPDATAEKNLFFVSKLQSLKGFDPEIAKNIEVSLDPLNPTQLQITIDNLRTLKEKFPEVKIQARIRSLISKNPIIKAQMQKAIDITNELKIPTLETRLRWKRGSSANIFGLDTKFYKKSSSGTLKLKKAAAKGAYQSSVCDDADSASCADCLNCFKGFGITPPKQTVFPRGK